MLHPDFGPPSYGIPFDVVDGSHPTVHVEFGYADESDPGPYPFGPDIHDRGRVRPARDHDRPRHVHALRAVRGASGTAATRRPGAARSSTWRAERERPAAGDLDDRRRGRPADLPGARPVGRGQRRRDRPRDPVHGGLHAAGATSGRRATRPGAATTACPPMGARFRLKAGFDTAHFSADAKVDDPRDEALRADRGRQRQRLVLPGRRSTRSGPTTFDGSAEVDPRGRVRRGGRGRVPGVAELRARSPTARRAPRPSATSARKFSTIRGPSGVRIDSGWNWTPKRGSSRCCVAITSPSSVHAVSSSSSGRSSRSTTSEW